MSALSSSAASSDAKIAEIRCHWSIMEGVENRRQNVFSRISCAFMYPCSPSYIFKKMPKSANSIKLPVRQIAEEMKYTLANVRGCSFFKILISSQFLTSALSRTVRTRARDKTKIRTVQSTPWQTTQ